MTRGRAVLSVFIRWSSRRFRITPRRRHERPRGPLFLEKVEGYAEEMLKNFKFGPNDAFIIISTSGIRPVIVEMARGVKERGMPVIAMLSRNHCENAKPGHSSGKKLIDYADIVLDNHCPQGDCIVEIDGLEWRTGPTSTVTGAMIMNMLRCEIAERLVAKGCMLRCCPATTLSATPVPKSSLNGTMKRIDRVWRICISE
ncbi:MAG: sugar isomerase domain-containing protein [Caldilineaceae bacterium]